MTTLRQPATLAIRPRELLFAFLVTTAAFGLGLAFGARPLMAMVASLGLLTAIACLARPNAAIYIVVAVLYSNAAAIAVNFHGLPYFVGIAFPLLLAIPLADQLVMRRRTVTVTSALPLLLGYLIVSILSTAAARDPSVSLDHLVVFVISGMVLYFIVTNVIRSLATLRLVVWTILVVAGALGALSAYQMVTQSYGNNFFGFAQVNLPGTATELTASLEGIFRGRGPIGEENRYGQILVVLLPIGALLAVAEKRPLLRLTAVGLTALILFGIATTSSRAAALGIAAMVLFGVFVFRYMRPLHLAAIVGLVVLALIAFPAYGQRLLDLQALTRLDRSVGGEPVAGDAGNLRGRMTQIIAAVYMVVDSPVLGVGPGQYRHHYQDYAKIVAGSFDARIDRGEREPHNLYLGMAAERGVLGFVLFMGIFYVTLRDLYRARKRTLAERPELAHLATAFILALVAYLVTGIAMHLAFERFVWLLLALAGVTAHLALHGEDDSAARSQVHEQRSKPLAVGPA